MIAGFGVVELNCYSELVVGLADSACQHSANMQLLVDLAYVKSLRLEPERRCSGHHLQARHLLEGINQFVSEAVAQELLLAVTKVNQRQNGNGGFTCGKNS